MLPHLLLVEDDPTSLAFLQGALEALPAQVASATSRATALAAAPAELYLIDVNLHDGSGAQLLAELQQRYGQVLALAHTADTCAATRDHLLAAGFREVVLKPVAAAELQAVVRQLLAGHAGGFTPTPRTSASGLPAADAPLWDDVAALRALGGKPEAMHALRRLFLKDLPVTLEQLGHAARTGDAALLHRELHRLKASCGFVGTPRLQAVVIALDKALPDASLLEALLATAQATLAANPVPPQVRA